ncbi:hypothetical protein [Chitinophaga sancti]|uniref:Uncharacterized protein n=2 Tax=Chitinophaga sancti TaxID=1004 RepID=A0ABZ0XIE6_9BACT|nr:hypothetical protein [Chitinophaga sancti]WQD63985.1 hypothetical protein U0033_06215 [Chitinophaga sancti]WQG90391.1 hypothetical protein SR876_02705 [Chitinophaga sancti]
MSPKKQMLRDSIVELLKSNPKVDGAPPQMVTVLLVRVLESSPYSYERNMINDELASMVSDGFIRQDSTHTVYYEDGIITSAEGDGFFPGI